MIEIELNRVYCGDCLELMKGVLDRSVDLVLCDLPYGVTHNKWDSILSLPLLWEQYRRILTTNGCVVLTATQPFASTLVVSNLPWFQYSLVWEKNIATGHLDSRRRPMRKHEDVLVFSPQNYQAKDSIYNPQMETGEAYVQRRKQAKGAKDSGSNYGAWNGVRTDTINQGCRFPASIIRFDREIGLHPTQKPISLFEHLIHTYTHPGSTVLDNCCGSGTTGVACQNTGRNFIQMDLSPEYCEIARRRLYMPDEEIRKELKDLK